MRPQVIKRFFAKSNDTVLRKHRLQEKHDLSLKLIDMDSNLHYTESLSEYQLPPSNSMASRTPGSLTFGKLRRDDTDSVVSDSSISLVSSASFNVAFTGSNLAQLTIEEVLEKLKLTQYTKVLVEDMGFEVAEDLSGITVEQLKKDGGMKLAHANKLVSAITSALNGS